MQKRQLGKSDLQVFPITFGGNVFGWTIDEKTSFEILDAFTGFGFNFIDTADVYTKTNSETSLGIALKGKWDKVVLATTLHPVDNLEAQAQRPRRRHQKPSRKAPAGQASV